MRAYGIQRYEATSYPDSADVSAFGRSSKYGKRKSKAKQTTRRIQARRARAANKALCVE